MDLILIVRVKINDSAWFATSTPTRGSSRPITRRMPSPMTPIRRAIRRFVAPLNEYETIYSIPMS
jgi:hypothetical protein